MISISSSTAALCPQSYASMAPCTECAHHHATDLSPCALTRPRSQSQARQISSLPFPPSMSYLHAHSSRILTPARATQLYPDDVEAQEAARFWVQTDGCIDAGFEVRCSDAEWAGVDVNSSEVDDDSRSDLGAPEVDEATWDAPPPAYEEASKSASSSSSSSSSSPSSVRSRASSDLSPEAGTLRLTVNASVLPRSTSTFNASPASASTPTPISIEPKQPSFLSLAFLGPARAHARAVQRAQRRAAQLEELHDAWARLGLNTREMLARGGQGALPPFFEHPPACTSMDAMLEELRL
ncbi:hypothetical protein OC835_003268 [Tilletia horrida]|nr:hypothetical protein OC835_003268 [Tilletia horrida]